MTGRKTILCATCDEVLTEKSEADFFISGESEAGVKSLDVWWCPKCKDFTLTSKSSAALLRAGISIANDK